MKQFLISSSLAILFIILWVHLPIKDYEVAFLSFVTFVCYLAYIHYVFIVKWVFTTLPHSFTTPFIMVSGDNKKASIGFSILNIACGYELQKHK
jgi:hypothetical protein